MNNSIFFMVIFIFFGYSQKALSQSSHRLLQEADKHFQNGNYAEAEEKYRKALSKESSFTARYNLGNTVYKQERYEEAVDHFLDASSVGENDLQSSDAFYNLGNAYFQNGDLENAIESFKQAIKFSGSNREAQYNLAVAKEILRMQQQQQQDSQQNNEESGEQQNEEQQEQQDGESQQKEDQENQEDSQSEQSDSTQQIEAAFDSSRLDKQSIDSLDAAKLLEIIQSEELKVQEKLRKYKSNAKKPEKDW